MRNINERSTDIVANTSEKFLCASIKHTEITDFATSGLPLNENDMDKQGKEKRISYIDSMVFLNSLLRSLGDNLPTDKFHSVRDFAT